MNIFEAHNIVKQYAGHRALDDVSISVPEGKIFGLLGPNGAGKTTLIRIINQITGPDTGSLLFKGKPLVADDVFRIGYLPEERGLYRKMKVGEQAIYLAMLKGLSRSDAIKKLKFWFEKFEIQPWWNKKVQELSKGMQQKVQFIVTILHQPELLIFDEPFSGFDPINTNLLKNEILALKEQGTSIIFSTHNMASVEEICDHISLINKSQKILEGKVEDVKNNFADNSYECYYEGDFNKVHAMAKDEFILDEHQENHKTHYIKIKLRDGQKNNVFLGQLMNEVNIISFNRVIPTMDDIFIKVVKEAVD